MRERGYNYGCTKDRALPLHTTLSSYWFLFRLDDTGFIGGLPIVSIILRLI
jgi:hypothetical protein